MVSDLSLSKQTIIYQMFQGLYQSSLTCLKCRRQSNTYDPYLCLSLPLPQICNRAIYIIIVYLDPNVTLKRIGILMKNTETFGDLRKCLSHLPSQYPTIPKLKVSTIVFLYQLFYTLEISVNVHMFQIFSFFMVFCT